MATGCFVERTFGPLRGIVPKTVERFFGYRRRLLPKLALCAWKALSSFLREDTGGDALPAAIVSIQKILHHIGRRFDPLKLPGRSPPLSDPFRPDPLPRTYGPQ